MAVVLAELSPGDRKQLLIDLLAEGQVDHEATDERVDAGNIADLTAQAENRTMVLLAALSEKPGMPIADLAERVYGDSEKHSQSKTRSLMAALHKQKRIHRMGAGRWEVVK